MRLISTHHTLLSSASADLSVIAYAPADATINFIYVFATAGASLLVVVSVVVSVVVTGVASEVLSPEASAISGGIFSVLIVAGSSASLVSSVVSVAEAASLGLAAVVAASDLSELVLGGCARTNMGVSCGAQTSVSCPSANAIRYGWPSSHN